MYLLKNSKKAQTTWGETYRIVHPRTSEILGSFAFNYNWDGSITVWQFKINEFYRKNGYAKRAIKELVEKYGTVRGAVRLDNTASRALMKSLGGKEGKVVNHGGVSQSWWEISKNPENRDNQQGQVGTIDLKRFGTASASDKLVILALSIKRIQDYLNKPSETNL